jgi:hypothetical protein
VIRLIMSELLPRFDILTSGGVVRLIGYCFRTTDECRVLIALAVEGEFWKNRLSQYRNLTCDSWPSFGQAEDSAVSLHSL